MTLNWSGSNNTQGMNSLSDLSLSTNTKPIKSYVSKFDIF